MGLPGRADRASFLPRPCADVNIRFFFCLPSSFSMCNFSFLGFSWVAVVGHFQPYNCAGFFECQNVAFPFFAHQRLFFSVFSFSYSLFPVCGRFQDARRWVASFAPSNFGAFPHPRFLEVDKKSFAALYHLWGAASMHALFTNSVCCG